MLCGVFSCSESQDGDNDTLTDEVQVYLTYTLDTSNGNDMRSTANSKVFNEFYDKIKSGDLLASTYNITFTNVDNGAVYNFNGEWAENDFITIRTGKYNVKGYSTSEGTAIQSKCSIIFDEQIDISISSNVVALAGIYDCSLLVFNDDNVQSLQNFDGENFVSFFSFNTYKYAFINTSLYLPSHNNDAYIIGKFTNNAEFKIYTGELTFTKGKFYVYNSVNNELNIPPMEEGLKDISSKYIEICGIKWATGNLQYSNEINGDINFQPKWRIAPTQWHFFNYDKEEYVCDSSSNGIDHFTWGICGNSDFMGNTNVYATATNIDIGTKFYSDKTCSTVVSEYSNAYYGDLAFWASNGQYRLPTADELYTLLEEASYQLGYYIVDGVKIYGYLFTNPETNRITSITERQITEDELEDGVFLPLGGYANSNSNKVDEIGWKCAYWSSYSNNQYPETLSCFGDALLKGQSYSYYGQWRSDLNCIRPIYIDD